MLYFLHEENLYNYFMKSSELKITIGVVSLVLALYSGIFILSLQDEKSDIKPLNYDYVSIDKQMVC